MTMRATITLPWPPVNSGSIREFAYEAEDRHLFIRFTNGSIFCFTGVGLATAHRLLKAGDRGAFLYRNVISKLDQCPCFWLEEIGSYLRPVDLYKAYPRWEELERYLDLAIKQGIVEVKKAQNHYWTRNRGKPVKAQGRDRFIMKLGHYRKEFMNQVDNPADADNFSFEPDTQEPVYI